MSWNEDQGWWSRTLGTPPARQQAPQPQAYQQPPQPQGYPPQQPQAYQQPQQGYPQQPAPQGYPQQQQPYQPQQPVINNIHDAVHNMQYWTGGEAAATETQNCPSCGGGHYFSRRPKGSRLPPPAPMCYTCGYTGLFQQGDQSTWESGVSA